MTLQQQLATIRMVVNPALTRDQADGEAEASIARAKGQRPVFDGHSLKLPKLTFIGVWSLPALDDLIELAIETADDKTQYEQEAA